MSECEIKNAVIESVSLSCSDHGVLDSWIQLDYGGGSGQGFSGYDLYLPKSYTHHKPLSHAGHFIFRVMEVAGVEDWDKLRGKTVRARVEDGVIRAIGHIVKDDWFCPSLDFKKEASKWAKL